MIRFIFIFLLALLPTAACFGQENQTMESDDVRVSVTDTAQAGDSVTIAISLRAAVPASLKYLKVTAGLEEGIGNYMSLVLTQEVRNGQNGLFYNGIFYARHEGRFLFSGSGARDEVAQALQVKVTALDDAGAVLYTYSKSIR